LLSRLYFDATQRGYAVRAIYCRGEGLWVGGGGRVGEVRVDWLLAQVPQCKMENEKMKNGCRIQMAVVRWKMVVLI
jgi:hypothetical protein